VGDSTLNAAFLSGEGLGDSVHSWEVQLVLEMCDMGSLRSLLNKQGPFVTRGACFVLCVVCVLCVCVLFGGGRRCCA
jgi:hypothetical protein